MPPQRGSVEDGSSKTSPPGKATTYRDAGVDIDAARRSVDRIRDRVRSTFAPEVVGDIGAFGAAFAFDPSKYRDPVLISSTDGVGTKVLVAHMAGRHETVGFDLVAHCANDVATTGAQPLFFLDYIVIERVSEPIIEELVRGMTEACRDIGCALIGGEVAEHPGHLISGSYDLAGFIVGVVERDKMITGSQIVDGDVLLGISSSGLHCNGYALARKVLLDDMGLELEDHPMELPNSLGEELLRPMVAYSPMVAKLTEHVAVKGLAHITGGGIPENLARVIPEGLKASVEVGSWEPPSIFGLISSLGHVPIAEMYSTFNMGVGMIVAVDPTDANRALDLIRSRGHHVHEIGLVTPARSKEKRVDLK